MLICRLLLQSSSGDQHWVLCMGSLHSRLQHLSLSETGLCLLGYQWSWSLSCHPNRSKPYCRFLPCKTSLPFCLCFANAMSQELASTLAGALLPIVLRFGPYLLAIGQFACKLTQLHKKVAVPGHHCIAQHLGWIKLDPQLYGMMSSCSQYMAWIFKLA